MEKLDLISLVHLLNKNIFKVNMLYTLKLGDHELSMPELRMIQIIYKKSVKRKFEVYKKDLDFMQDKAHTSRVLKKLEKKEFIEIRNRIKGHWVIYLTKKGVDLYNKFNEESENNIDNFFKNFTDTELETMAALIKKTIELIEREVKNEKAKIDKRRKDSK